MAAHRLQSSTPLRVWRLEGGKMWEAEDVVSVEEPLEIQISHTRRGIRANKSLSITMRTPGHDLELAVGFLFSENLLPHREWIEEIASPEANIVRIAFRDGIELDLRSLDRHFYTTSSCGVCGKASLEALQFTRRSALRPGWPIFAPEVIHSLPTRLRAAQTVFEKTGGLHAAAFFDPQGDLQAVREDVGRHNAVDKLIGAAVLAGREDFSNLLLFVSGRASFELMQKALMAGIPLLAAVGAPSSLAVDLAQQSGATLLGFVRDGRCNIYTSAGRIATTRPQPSLVIPVHV